MSKHPEEEDVDGDAATVKVADDPIGGVVQLGRDQDDLMRLVQRFFLQGGPEARLEGLVQRAALGEALGVIGHPEVRCGDAERALEIPTRFLRAGTPPSRISPDSCAVVLSRHGGVRHSIVGLFCMGIADDRGVRWSPDGRWLAFPHPFVSRRRQSGGFFVDVVSIEGGRSPALSALRAKVRPEQLAIAAARRKPARSAHSLIHSLDLYAPHVLAAYR